MPSISSRGTNGSGARPPLPQPDAAWTPSSQAPAVPPPSPLPGGFPRAGRPEPEGQGTVLRVTSTRDGREHLVAEEAMTPGSTGRYVAMCGHGVWAAVLTCPPGPPCSDCIVAANRDAEAVRRRHRTDRPGMWARLTARLHVAAPRRHLPAAQSESARPVHRTVP